MRRLLAIALLAAVAYLALATPAAQAQGCGPQNPNCIVPFRPAGDNTNAAASTAWVQANVGAGSVTSVFTRTGAVVAVSGDYSFALISGSLAFGQMPSISANSVYGNIGGGATGLGVPSCSGGTNALIWTSGTGFGCNTISGSGSPGGSSGQVQWNSAGSFAGFTMSGDCTLVTSTGVITCTKVNGVTATQTIGNGTAALGTSAITSGACASAVTVSATGVATTDTVQASFNGDPTGVTGYLPATTGMLVIIPYPTTNNVNFKVCNNTAASITPGAITLNWRVVR
jgi:hypothetical protein